ncbi:MAG: M23 family metallopeptidase, partial [Empedobacter falsenii]
NNSVEGLLIASYTDNGTNVYFSYVKKDSDLYLANIKLFQEKFDRQINNSINKKANGDNCGFEGLPSCDLDEVIITPNPGGSGCSNCYTTPPENGGSSGCSQFVECIDNPPGGGGGTPIIDPCPKNPLKNIDIASPSSSGKNGGRYGNTRTDKYGNKKFHDGLDLTASPGTNLYSMYNGYIIDSRNSFENGEYKSKSYGNYITIESTINGETVTLKFNHLNKNNSPIKIGTYVSAGQLIGQTGITGNAAAKGVVPHVHIQASKNGNKTNPESYIGAKFDSKGNTISNGCK